MTQPPAPTPGYRPDHPPQTRAAHSLAPAALAEPTVAVRARWVTLLVLATLSVWMGFFTPIQKLLPEQIQAIDPAHKETMLGWVTALGAAAAVVFNPIAGALSDRTTSRYGRRHVWTAGGALLSAVALIVLARQHTILGVAIGWVAAQACLNTMAATLTAAVPDRVPVRQRGAVSGWIGIPQILGIVLGVVLVTVLVTDNARGYVALAVLVVLLALPFTLFTPDERLPREHRPTARIGSVLASMWVSPRRYPDFAWAWITRFLVSLGNALGTLYLLYFLQDRVHLRDPDTGLLILILVYTAGIVATTVVAGRRSDRTGRRRGLVVWSGIIMAAAALLLAIWPLWPVAIVAAFVLGAGYGIYIAVDAALITQVLPSATDRAKDLGVINIANSAPQVLGPALSAPIVVHLGGYPVLYALTAVVTLLGGVFVLRIRGVP